MASIEFINKRIEGKEKEIEKLKKKLDRINAAKATNWEKNPYYYNERDLTSTEKELAIAEVALEGYRNSFQSEMEKAGSRDIAVILEFLSSWKARVIEFYRKSFDQYLIELEEWRAYDAEYVDWCNACGYALRKTDREVYDKRVNDYYRKKDSFKARWNFIAPYVTHDYGCDLNKLEYSLDNIKLEKDLDRDADAKYDFIVERTNAIVGQITDASNLSIGDKGDLNGTIVGTRGVAKVQTIGAGGYNEDVILDSGRHGQRFHFRTLINALK